MMKALLHGLRRFRKYQHQSGETPPAFCSQETDEIERRRLCPQSGKRGMDLSAMVRLVIEHMSKGRGKPLAYRAHFIERGIAIAPTEFLGVEPVGIAAYARVFRLPQITQHDEIVGNDRIQRPGMIAFGGEALHPDTVGDQQMIECAVNGAEEQAKVEPVLLVAQFGSGGIDQFICPSVIIGKHLKVLFHESPRYPIA